MTRFYGNSSRWHASMDIRKDNAFAALAFDAVSTTQFGSRDFDRSGRLGGVGLQETGEFVLNVDALGFGRAVIVVMLALELGLSLKS